MMKNLAGNDVSIFLFRFVLRKNSISFVLNESIAEDMYPEIDEEMQPLVQACSDTLLRYRDRCQGDTIMDGSILVDNCFEVMLSKGLGSYFPESEKENLFKDAHEIAKLLLDVMDRRTREMEQGTYPGPQPVINKIKSTESTNNGLETLGQERDSLEELPIFESEFSGLKRLTPDDLPDGVSARKGYDHRGRCYAFEHEVFGDLGKIVLIGMQGAVRLEADLYKGNVEFLPQKEEVFKEVISTVEHALRNLAPTN
jgi:hypothetical protein